MAVRKPSAERGMSTPSRVRDTLPSSRTKKLNAGDVFTLLYGALGFIFFNLGAQVYLVEVVAVLIVAHAFLSRAKVRVGVALLVGIALWLLSTLMSDIGNSTDFLDAFKGIARVLATLVLLVALFYLIQDAPHRVPLLWVGVAMSLLVGLLLAPNPYFSGEPWKFGLAQPITLLVVLASTRYPPHVSALLAAGAGALNFVMGTRSLAIVCLIVALVLLVASRTARGGGGRRLVVVSALGVALMIAIVQLYDSLALNGFFGEERRIRADAQSAGEFGAFLTGRGEIFFSLRSIAQDPMLGVGSYGIPDRAVIEAQASLLQSEGYATVARNYLEDGISSFHSELFGAVAENGLLAAVFWITVGVAFVGGLVRVIGGGVRYSPLVVYLSVLGLWDLLFSPFGADRKFWLAASLVSVIVLCRGKAPDARLRHHD